MYIHPDFFAEQTPALVGWRSVETTMSFSSGSQLYKSARVFELGWDNMTIFSGFMAALDLIEEIGTHHMAKRIEDLTEYLLNELLRLNIPILSNTEKQNRSGIVKLGPLQQLENIIQLLENHNIWVTQRD